MKNLEKYIPVCNVAIFFIIMGLRQYGDMAKEYFIAAIWSFAVLFSALSLMIILKIWKRDKQKHGIYRYIAILMLDITIAVLIQNEYG